MLFIDFDIAQNDVHFHASNTSWFAGVAYIFVNPPTESKHTCGLRAEHCVIPGESFLKTLGAFGLLTGSFCEFRNRTNMVLDRKVFRHTRSGDCSQVLQTFLFEGKAGSHVTTSTQL